MRKKFFTFLLALAASVGLMNAAVDGKLPGAFSVSSTKVVYFSQGNLQATTSDQGATWTWGFAENQWDYVGNAAANTSFDYWGGKGNGSYDLFGWIGESSALDDYRQYGIGSNYDFTDCGNTPGENLKVEWGSLMGSDWRTLTYDEWQYLIKSRNNAANLLAYATVNGKTGLILLPDSWASSSVALTITTANYTTNIISASDWSTLEEQGCVFLPAAGSREDSSVSGVGAGGDYWSSSSPSGKQYDEGSAYCFFFDTDFSKQADGMHFNKRGRGYGLSVRLVSETAPSGGSTPEPSETTVTWDLSDMASMGTQGGYFKAKGVTLMSYGVDNGMSGYGSHEGAFFGGPFVFTTSLGKFTKIEVTNSYLYEQPAFSGDDWTLDGTNAVWEGTPAALVSLVSNFGGITQIKFTIDPNTSTPANSCGDGLTWAVNDGVLTISYDGEGTGSMDNYEDYLSMPWRNETFSSVVLPEGLISIGQNAFAVINTFSQITLPSTLQYILMNAFTGSGLTSVTIPANVKGIGASAFISSQSLATVTFEPTTPPRVGGNAFENCHSDLIIYYPCESRAQYYKDMQADIAYYHDKMNNCPAPPSNLHVTELEPPASWSGKSTTYLAVADMPGFEETDAELAETWEAPTDCNSILIYHVTEQDGDYRMYYHYFYSGNFVESQDGWFPLGTVYSNYNNGLKTFYTSSGGGSTPAVDPAVQNVIDLINAIPNPVVYNQECYNALDAVYEAYRVLSSEQKSQVTNYNDYLAAEERYYMLADVNYVIEKINEIGNVEFTSACKNRINNARNSYKYLNSEAKALVTNYNTLLSAEAAYAALIPYASKLVWNESILETIDVDDWGVAEFTNGGVTLTAIDGHAYYTADHFLLDGDDSELAFTFSTIYTDIVRVEITVSEKIANTELNDGWVETANGYRWIGEDYSVNLGNSIPKVTEITFYLGEPAPAGPTPAQEGDKLPGAFSVDDGKVVYFSKSNLRFVGTWQFTEHQWDIVGNAQANKNRDLFCWGTGDNPNKTRHTADYSTYTEWGNNIEGNWRTMTKDEWIYLFSTRTDASSKYGTAKVAGINGIIVLPDAYDGPAINTNREEWENNTISSSEWAAYEAAGAVFLPAAGTSDAYGVYATNEDGNYWSSTKDELTYNSHYAFFGFGFEGWFFDKDAEFHPQTGKAVRLVSETAPSGGSDPEPETHDVDTNEDPENPGVYHYSTFFHSTQNYKLTNDGTQAFIADLSGSDLVLTKIAEGTQVIPANTAVILRKTGSNEPVALAPTSEPGVSFSATNDLLGSDEAMAAPSNCYVLSGQSSDAQVVGVGFYQFTGTLAAHKAYVIYSAQSPAPRRMRFVFDSEQVATSVDNAEATISIEKRIENGQLIIIRNGEKFNAQGMIVK